MSVNRRVLVVVVVVVGLILIVGLILSFALLEYEENSKTNSDVLASHKILAEFAVATRGDVILLPVKFKGKEYSFVLDTGSSVTIFDVSLRHLLGSVKGKAILETAKDPMYVQLFDAPEAFLGPLNLQECREVTCIDHKVFGFILGREISGTIGMDFLKKYMIQIDFDRGRFLFIQPTGSSDRDWGEELRITYDLLGRPKITGTIFNTIKVDFVIDTGLNSTGVLNTKIFREISKNRVMKTSEILTQTASGTIREMNFRTDYLSFGPLKYEGLIFNSADGSLLGLEFLARHIVTFDFPNNRVYFKQGRNFKKADEADMSGLHLLRLHVSKETFVHSVDKGSPAEKAGIKANDLILQVENKDINKYDMQELRRFLMSGDGQEITMKIKRITDVREVSFLLEKKI
jgi:predicted aspartyl protease